ncbi:multidrug ABC transporter ATPase [Amycolatopsis mediterranei S699]|uniref:ATPase component of ABC-type multidrug transport system n=2 Tax=Amycolatopsis mediterranei TaxID=33910 RepID=A0A0H3DGW5_AMYMU|nr:ATP-binding cassette domain-containing protein [Amycolatopsis mediterranei]ADJ49951.1 ATPase component of ABC-type multidrug transport system [Amycolatopsis mediterranei U32]AEK46944.1 multidrug ABC transporter ATPase [Amycolatopsis mediterranei S699]AFO81659.1 multidrug ABC transporter ATPase [Amycolatopsis mediterranei S699]AGT88788.1 multidrug ABC transporter ATPase [Amycolatopsis mediterranei RB]KDO07801.1 ABC transporter [Amycolatopsis mediterranei]
MITARGLERRFRRKGRTGGEVHAVKGVDLDVEAGELVGFLGPNGAGKTTTLRMLTTLLKPTAGTATVGGCDLLSDPLGVRKRIGYVAQGGGSAPESKVADELELQGRLYRMSKADAIARGAELAEQLDLTGLDQRLTKTLSGGQRRRLDIALGLIHSPGLVFLDEPSTGLDPQSRANLWDHIRRLRAEQGVTVFLTTHYLDEADALSDRLIVIDDGRIVAEGTPDALKARVNGDRVEVGVEPEQAADAAEIAGRLTGAQELGIDGGEVRFRVPRGDVALPELLRALDAKGIAMLSVQVHRPTLDDVFLTLTGRSLREAEEAGRAA